MIHEVRKIGPWFDLDEVAAIDLVPDGHTRVTLKSGNEFDFFATIDQIENLVAAWMMSDQRRNIGADDRRRSLT